MHVKCLINNKQIYGPIAPLQKIPSLSRVTSAGIGLSDYLELTLGFYHWVREELMNLAIVLDKSRCETS